MKRHLIDVHNIEEPKQTASIDSKDAASQGHATRGTLSGFITKHFVPHFTAEEHKHAYTLMVKAHSAAILPPSINDIPEFRQYLEYISHGGYSLPHRTKTTELEDAAVAELEAKIKASVQRASSIALTTDGAGTHTGESYVAVTGHWIDRIPTPTQSLGKCTWKLVSAVLAVSIDNESHTADNIAQLLKDCTQLRYQMGTRLDSITTDNGANFKAAVQILLNEDITEENPACACHTFSLVVKNSIDPCKKKVPHHDTRDFIQMFRDITSSIRNSSQRLEHLKRLQRKQIEENLQAMELINDDVTLSPDELMHSKALTVIKDIVTRWNSTFYMLERCLALKPYIQEVCVKAWDELPTEVYQCYLELKAGFRSRFDPTSFLLTDAALVHPGHKSLNWLTPREQANAIEQFKEELLNIAGVNKEPLQTMTSAVEHSDHGSVSTTRIPLDSYFDFEATAAERNVSLTQTSKRDIVLEELKCYLQEPLTNWRVNNAMEWWSDHEVKFPHVALMAQKYLAIPASSAPSERVRMDGGRVERVIFLRCNKNFNA
eukprot:Em0010g694a